MQTKNQISLSHKVLYVIMLMGIFLSAFGTGWDQSIAWATQEKYAQSQIENTSLYMDAHFGFSFQYPKEWILERGQFIDAFDQVYQVRILQSYAPYIGILVSIKSNPDLLDVVEFILTDGKGREVCQDCPKAESVMTQVINTPQGQATQIVGYPLENSVSINFVLGDAILTLETIAAGDGFPLYSHSDAPQITLETILAQVLDGLQLPPASKINFSPKITSPNLAIAVAEVADSFRFPTDSDQRIGVAYGSTNPNLTFDGVNWSTCYNMQASILIHAGDDLTGSTATEVKAVANGQVVKIDYQFSPGRAVVISHMLPSGETIYSFYAHLDNLSVSDNPPTIVDKGAVIGHLLNQYGNTHTHWEMRDWATTTEHWCVGATPPSGPGYTPPGISPDSRGYKNPTLFVKDHTPAVILYENANYQGHSLMLTQSDLDLCDNPLDSSQPPVSPCFSAPSWTDVASSIKVMPGYRAVLHIHNQADADRWHDDATMSYSCNTDIPDFQGVYFPNGTPLNDNVSRVIIEKCGTGNSVNPAFPGNDISIASTNPCDPEPPPSLTDNASFISDITLPDGTVVSPGQALTKTWRVQNIGTSTWGSGYQLVYLRGERMGMPPSINVPTTAPGENVDLSIGLTTPTTPGEYFSYWRLRNPEGTYFGQELWVILKVMDTTQSDGVDFISATYPSVVSPGQSFRPEITVKVKSGSLQGSRGDMLRNKDGNLYGAWPHVAVEGSVGTNQLYTFVFYADNPITAPANPGTYTSIWQVWADGRYVGPEIEIEFRVFSGNYPPNPPNLNNPGDYASGYDTPQFCAAHNGDPDGDAITGYQFEFVSGPTSWQSGWVSPPSNCAWPSSMAAGQYTWHARVQDNHGNVSNWSNENRHFTKIAGVDITLFDFDHSSPSNAEQIWIHTNGTGDFNETILTVNAATDCSDSGEWRGINHYAGGREVNSLWGTLGLLDGCHRVRLEIKGIGGADVEEKNFTLLHRRPSTPFAVYPNNNSWVNNQTVTFSWQTGVQPNLTYRLIVSQNPNPISDPSPLFNQEFNEEKLSHTITFGQDYPNLYWYVSATNDVGMNDSGIQHFGIDQDPPISSVEALPPITTITQFTVRWNGTNEQSGLRWYQVQFKDGERGEWQNWLIDTTKIADLFSGQPGHIYYFRAQAMDNVGNWEGWPDGNGDTYTFVDPSAVPPTPWWNSNYTYKRNIVILNNDNDPMIVHYPTHVHFDGSTNPTAVEIYNASSSATKGDDVRIVYNDQTELTRFIQRFTTDQIDIWFSLQSPIDAAATDDSNYQVYYGYAGAASPSVDVSAIFLPAADANTVGLWHFQEGTGSSVADTSGRGHDGTFISPGWNEGWLGWTGAFNGSGSYVDAGNSNDFNVGGGPMTIEAWVYLDHITNSPPIVSKWGASDTYASYLLRVANDRRIYWVIRASGGNREVYTGLGLTLHTWYHIAATYDGVNTMRVFVNGEQWGVNTNAANGFSSTGPLRIGYDGLSGVDATYFPGYIQHVRVSNVQRTSFPYAYVTNSPSVGVGNIILPPESGSPDLVVLGISTYPSPAGGFLIEAVVQNQGDIATLNGFYTDLYVDRVPTGAGDYSGSIQFWVNDPIGVGETVTLTTLVTDVSQLFSAAKTVQSGGESSITLYAQTDSTGAVTEADNGNNIYTQGTTLCVANPDGFENDGSSTNASLIAVGSSQTHNFHLPGDSDWIKFNAQAGKTYRLTTGALGISADTYLYLYATDGITLLASNDDFNNSLASQIEWTAPQNGTYYALVKHWNPSAGGCGTQYNLNVQEGLLDTSPLFLPLILR